MASDRRAAGTELPTLQLEYPSRPATSPPNRPDNGRGHSQSYDYIVIIAAAMVLSSAVGYSNTLGFFQEYYQATILADERPSKIIVIGSVPASLYLTLGAFAGRFADLVGHRPALLLGSALLTGAMFATSASNTFGQLLLSQGLMFGFGVAFAHAPTTSISKQYWHQNHGVANAVVVLGGALGGCILPFSVRLMINDFGLAQAFRVLGYVAAVVLIPSSLLLT